jgi:hypothetical protein
MWWRGSTVHINYSLKLSLNISMQWFAYASSKGAGNIFAASLRSPLKSHNYIQRPSHPRSAPVHRNDSEMLHSIRGHPLPLLERWGASALLK